MYRTHSNGELREDNVEEQVKLVKVINLEIDEEEDGT